MSDLRIEALTCEYREHCLGTDVRRPRFSWIIQPGRRGVLQTAYRIQLTAGDDFQAPLWDTGHVASSDSVHIEYAGPELQPRTAYQFRVKVWDHTGSESDWSKPGQLETALYSSNAWQAKWTTPDTTQIEPEAEPAFLLRREFGLCSSSPVVSARVYSTATGLYELYINGFNVSEDVFAPGWTSYHHRQQYQTYDVTHLLRQGTNAMGVLLGDGWYRGGLGFDGRNYMYGPHRSVLVQLHIRHEDGMESVVVSDTDWRSSLGPILYSNIYHGETYDARLEQSGWTEAGFDDSQWVGTETLALPYDQLVAQENVPTRVTEVVKPVQYLLTPEGDHVLDMGQNMVGRIRLQVQAPAGTRIELRHAEVLDRNGNIYFGNLRPARQTVTYIAKGEGAEEYAPYFSFQGFRYVKVEGFPDSQQGLPLDAFQGEVTHSDMVSTGDFSCSDERVNQLQRNIRWGQRGNFLDVPTDCPQRDERLGWTGDAQVFIGTALFNYHGGSFFTKWLRDVKAEQHLDGGIPFVVPDIVGGANSAAWGDAAVICPWTVYQFYGDLRLLAEQYDSMKRWVEYIRAQGENEFLWNTGFHFGDWLGLDAKENSYKGATPEDLIATAFYAHSTRLVRDTAIALGHEEDAQQYGRLLDHIVHSYRNEYMTPTGRVAVPTQTAHVLTLMFDLAEPALQKRVAADLNDLIIQNDYHLTTGFVGTPYLCFALSGNGYHSTAVRLLMQDSYPGWLYSVSKGATTIWEHWDSIKEDGSFWSDDMNSFNHYSYGAVGEWMIRKIAGLDMLAPGFRKARIEPLFGANLLTHASAWHQTPYGKLESGWRILGKEMEVTVTLPVNTTGRIILNGARLASLMEGGKAVAGREGIISMEETLSGVELIASSGSYSFIYEYGDLFEEYYTEKTRLNELLMHPHAREVVERHAPQLLTGATQQIVRTSSFREIKENGMFQMSPDILDAILEELSASSSSLKH
ncbi:family 78 glycoside hydrolase catalytic domain [Paenibacillus sp. UMB7766-LJ446]|uniref:alpha-L-rhamnosidase n=1 Tax=Paenibacillus sp. UMB7766-LJ446 TaxID=3046313 RepID=UPI002550782E|nr:alpha-L-rhamnosidase [Paenibacillus sp. UMB7766-LJ446]MDK8190175.1 family 78 glycoside hydrolase catalytic domain [Paenibacillus sp. UMB7766-LJ446]